MITNSNIHICEVISSALQTLYNMLKEDEEKDYLERNNVEEYDFYGDDIYIDLIVNIRNFCVSIIADAATTDLSYECKRITDFIDWDDISTDAPLDIYSALENHLQYFDSMHMGDFLEACRKFDAIYMTSQRYIFLELFRVIGLIINDRFSALKSQNAKHYTAFINNLWGSIGQSHLGPNAIPENNMGKEESGVIFLIEDIIDKTNEGLLTWNDKKQKDEFTGSKYYHSFFAEYEGKKIIFEIDVDPNEGKTFTLMLQREWINVLDNEDVLDELYYAIISMNQDFDWDEEFEWDDSDEDTDWEEDFELGNGVEEPDWEEDEDINGNIVLTLKDFFVVRSVYGCTNKEHKIEEITASVSVITPSGQRIEQRVMAGYCEECDCYYILKDEFDRLKETGHILCKIIDQTKPNSQDNMDYLGNRYSNYNTESKLRLLGYSVGADRGLTNIQRKMILESIVDEGELATTEICSFLSWLIKTRSNLPNHERAIEKWISDREYIKNYKRYDSRLVGIERLIIR